jgi:hypothetical protein
VEDNGVVPMMETESISRVEYLCTARVKNGNIAR